MIYDVTENSLLQASSREPLAFSKSSKMNPSSNHQVRNPNFLQVPFPERYFDPIRKLKLIERMSTTMMADEATYKLNWFDFPMLVSGHSSAFRKFFPTHLALSSHEDTSSWVRIFVFVKRGLGENPRYVCHKSQKLV